MDRRRKSEKGEGTLRKDSAWCDKGLIMAAVCLFCRMSSHLRAVQTRSDLRAIRGPSLRRVTGEYDEIEYAGLPLNSSIFVISLCRRDFQ
jgi:hypothetical protein